MLSKNEIVDCCEESMNPTFFLPLTLSKEQMTEHEKERDVRAVRAPLHKGT